MRNTLALPLPGWVRLLANVSAQGNGRILVQHAVEDGGDLRRRRWC